MRSAVASPDKVRVGIIGVGNGASSFVQGLSFYQDTDTNEPIPGLMSTDIGGYKPNDITLASAFDVASTKIGRDVADAIKAPPNNTTRFTEVAQTGVTVQRGPTLDGLGRYLQDDVEE